MGEGPGTRAQSAVAAPAVAAPAVAEPAVAAGPTVQALRQIREGWAARRRKLRVIGLALPAVVVYLSATKAPRVGLHGDSLGLTFALTGFVIGLLSCRRALLDRPALWRWDLPSVALLVLSSAFLVWLQPDGPGFTGFLVALVMLWSGRAIPNRMGNIAVSAACLAMLLAAALTSKEHDHSRWLGVAVSVLPLVLFFFVAWLFVWNRRMTLQTEALLIQAEQTRDAELRAAALAERQRLARDMHDVLAHTLSGLTLQLEGVRLLAKSGGDLRVASAVERAHELAKNGLTEARQAISMLHGEELPGPDRLAALAEEFAADTGTPCRFSSSGQGAELRAEVKLALYRVTQEALTNIRKHAHPDHVAVRLAYRADEVDLAIQDFGTGPLAGPLAGAGPGRGGGYGLAGMRERAELLGGTLRAGPTEDGFLVELRVAP